MKLPEKIHNKLYLFLILILFAYLLFPLVYNFIAPPPYNISGVLARGPAFYQQGKYAGILIRRLFTVFLVLGILKAYKIYQENKQCSRQINKYRDAQNHVSSLNEKTAAPADIDTKKSIKKKKSARKKISRLSDKHAQKVIDSSAALGKLLL